MHTVLPLRSFATASVVFYGDIKYHLHFTLLPFPLKTFVLFPCYPVVPVEKKYEASLSSLPFLRLRFVLILAKHSLLAIERPIPERTGDSSPFFVLFCTFPLIVTLIKTKEHFNSMKHVVSVTHTYLSQYIAIYCFPIFEKDSLF